MDKKINLADSTKPPATPAAYFWYVSKPFKGWAISVIAIVVLATVLSQSTAYFFKLIVDAVESNNATLAMQYALLYPVAILVVQSMYRVSGYLGRHWVTNSSKYSNDRLTEHVLQHSHAYFSNRFAGSLMSKIMNVNNAVNNLIPDMLWHHLTALVSFAVTIIYLAMVDWQAASVFVVLVLVLIGYNRFAAPEKAALSKLDAEARTQFRARLVDTISNVQAVRQYARTANEEESIAALTEKARHTWNKSWACSEKMMIWNSIILFVFSLIMFWFLVTGWQQGNLTTGDFVFVLALYSQITGTLIFIGRAFNAAAQNLGEMREGLEELLVPFDIVDAPDAKPLLVPEGVIEWRKVSFEYDEQPVFTELDLIIGAGERLGLVGPSGSGKSTFVSLLLRQYELGAGSIVIDGQDIAHATQDSLRQAVAVVPQEPALFHRSIRENILYGNPYATEAEVIAVAKKAQAHDFISQLPQRYDTLVGERGVKLSGGQKQRVAIARAMLKDAPILVLDEATSALDSESEVEIQKALEILMEGRTVIAVAHRLSTLRKMDRILVMDSGQIIEDGTHESLAKAGGVYERLWNHQAGGFLKE
jgi:ATP-binding cassette subfamily B protein